MITVERPVSTSDHDDIRALMRAFVSWHREHHTEDSHLIDAYFDEHAFEHELATLDEYYAPPSGDLRLARLNDDVVGCVAFRRLDDTSCEMKRMFVYPDAQGHGIGRALGEAIVAAAQDSGYAVMRLDTSFRQTAALRLYRSLGFREVEPYCDMPQPLRDWLVFMELEL